MDCMTLEHGTKQSMDCMTLEYGTKQSMDCMILEYGTKQSMDCLTLQYGTKRLCRNVGNKVAICAVLYDAHLATVPQHIPTQQDMLPQQLVCK